MGQKNKKLIIFLAGETQNIQNIHRLIRADNFDFIAADGGYLLAQKLNVTPALVLGDFDSSAKPSNGEIVVFPCEKDDTDSALALQYGIQKGYTEIWMIAPFGGRFDHSMANLALLECAEDQNVSLKLYDGRNLVQLMGEGVHRVPEHFRYVSFLPWDATATVTLKGFKYNLDRALLHRGTPLGVSNETVKEPTVTVHCGKLICICIEKSQEDL